MAQPELNAALTGALIVVRAAVKRIDDCPVQAHVRLYRAVTLARARNPELSLKFGAAF